MVALEDKLLCDVDILGICVNYDIMVPLCSKCDRTL